MISCRQVERERLTSRRQSWELEVQRRPPKSKSVRPASSTLHAHGLTSSNFSRIGSYPSKHPDIVQSEESPIPNASDCMQRLLKENRIWINNLEWVKRRGEIAGSIGSSNWPTFTGVDELTFISYWYMGGRDVKMGNMVSARNPARKEGKKDIGLIRG